MTLWNITDWEHSRSRFGLLRWFCFYFCYTAVTSQSHTFKVVHLKHSLLTLYITADMKVLFHYLHWVSLFHRHWFLAFLTLLIHWELTPLPSESLLTCFSPLCFLLLLSLTTFFAFEHRGDYCLPSGCLDFFEWKM